MIIAIGNFISRQPKGEGAAFADFALDSDFAPNFPPNVWLCTGTTRTQIAAGCGLSPALRTRWALSRRSRVSVYRIWSGFPKSAASQPSLTPPTCAIKLFNPVPNFSADWRRICPKEIKEVMGVRWLMVLALVIVVGVILWKGVRAQMAAELLAERTKVSWTNVPKKVLAFYYAWYGNPQVSGKWVHWHDVDEANKRIGSSTHYPLLGPYDSHDPKVVEQHCRWAKEAGIDGFIVSWWHPNDFHDRAMPLILDTAQKFGLEITAYFETVPTRTKEQALEYVMHLLNRYGKHPAWLKLNGKPVIFVYGRAIGEIGLDGWLWVIVEANRRYEGGAVFIGDHISKRAARIFDGIHTYNITALTAGKSPEEIKAWAQKVFPDWVSVAGNDRIACLTIIPGYDDSKLPDRKPPRPITERHNGETYKVLWEAAIAANPDWVLITSWNEWHEGSEIEPSVEHGDRELKTTAEYARKFKQLPPRQRPKQVGLIPESDRKRLQGKLEKLPVAVLPGSDSEAVWWLIGMGAKLTVLDWEQVIDQQRFNPQNFPIVLYGGGEGYRTTVREQNDVLKSLQRYVRDGGSLVVMPSMPMPFHYDETRSPRTAVHHAPQLWLPLIVAWERPPEGLKLKFVVRNRNLLPHVPEQFVYPESGDLRWRPLVPEKAPPEAQVLPLIELVDESGRSHGLGAAIVQVGAGKVLYVWFRLLDIDVGEAILHDLWDFAVSQTSVAKG
jgi:hypothetical protein